MQDCRVLQGLVRDTVTPSVAARLYAGLSASTTLTIPVVAYGLLRHDWELPLTIAAFLAPVTVACSLFWVRAARECNRAGLWPNILGLVDMIRLRQLVLDIPYSILLMRYRKHLVSPADARATLLRIANAGAKRQGVFLDHALSTTKQPLFFAGDLANRLVEYSDEEPDAGRNLQQDLLAVAAETEWLNYEVAAAILHNGFRNPI